MPARLSFLKGGGIEVVWEKWPSRKREGPENAGLQGREAAQGSCVYEHVLKGV